MSTTAPADKCLITPAEAARRLELLERVADPARCVRAACKRGILRPVHIGRYLQIDPDSVARWLTLTEAARRLGLDAAGSRDPGRIVRRLVREKTLRAAVIGDAVYIDRETLDDVITGRLDRPKERRR